MEAISILDSVLMGLLLVVLVVCGTTDILYHRIKNVVTLPAIGLGILLNLAYVLIDKPLGWHYFTNSLAGFAVGFFVILVIFMVGGMGGGDVKFVAAIGAIDPFHFGYVWALWMIFYSVMAGGAISIVVMALKGKLLRSLKNVFRTFFTAVAPGFQTVPLKPEDSEKIPFGLGIALGTLWTCLLFMAGVLPT